MGMYKGRLFTLALLLISLQSYYFPALGLSPFPVLGALLLLLDMALSPRGRFGAGGVVLLVFFLCLFGWMLLTGVLNGYGTLLGKGGALVFNMLTVAALAGYRHDAAFWQKLARALRVVLVVHLLFWGVQLVYWLATRQVVDFLTPVTGEAQRVYSAKGLLLGADRIPRFSGLFNEPGTYANYIYVLLVLRVLARGRYDGLGVLASLTMLLSMSLYGALFAVVYMLLYALTARRKIVFWGALAGISSVGIGAIGYVYAQFAWRFQEGLGISGRLETVADILVQTNILFGLPADRLTFPAEDLTLYIAAYVTGGALLLAGILLVQGAMIAGKRRDLQVLLSTIFLAKLKLAYPVLWVLAVLAIYRKEGQE